MTISTGADIVRGNTSYGAQYEAFTPDVTLALCRHLEFGYTPKYGSWLNIAENELSVLTVQCVKGNGVLVVESQFQAKGSRLAIHYRKRKNKTQVHLS